MSLESEINKHIIHKLEQERDMYKRNWDKTLKERDTLIDDIAVLRANNEKLEWTLKNRDDEKDWLERENEKYIKLLKEFNNLINYKLAIHPGSDVYMYY
ncbi:hypothetical protein [Staphylococcus nepalensis]|uniref:hypothetical protein n=1 Tax=Staphylococcus nepalensis TaxID=214473 RepID=UPI0030180308